MCVYCSNVNIILNCISGQLSTVSDLTPELKSELRIRNVYKLTGILLCQKPFGMKFHNKECADSHCDRGKDFKVKIISLFSKFINAKGGNGFMKWQMWEQTTITANV